MSGSISLRKVKKPLIERKRRERINRCLDQLKRLVLEAKHSDEPKYSKMGKADILEMTVTHLRVLNHRSRRLSSSPPIPPSPPSPSPPPPAALRHQPLCDHRNSVSFSLLNQTDSDSIIDYEDGFTSCLTEVQRYLSSNPRQLRLRSESALLKHLRRRLMEHVQNTWNCALEGHRKAQICEHLSCGKSTHCSYRRNPSESESLPHMRQKWTSLESNQSSPFHLSMASSSETSFASSKDTTEENFTHCIESARFIPFNISSPFTAADVEVRENEEDMGTTLGARVTNNFEMMPKSKMVLEVTVPPSHLTEERNPHAGFLPMINSGSVDIDACSFHSSGSHPERPSPAQKASNETHRQLVWRPW